MDSGVPTHHPGIAPGLLHAPRPDQMPARVLTDTELVESLSFLHAHLHAARRSLIRTYLTWSTLTLLILGLGLLLLWFGPSSYLDRVLGVRQVNMTTTMLFWWLLVVVTAVAGGVIGAHLLSGKLRAARHWKHRVSELELRVKDAEDEQRRRLHLSTEL